MINVYLINKSQNQSGAFFPLKTTRGLNFLIYVQSKILPLSVKRHIMHLLLTEKLYTYLK